MATRNAKATWRGTLKEGEGMMGLGSGVWEGPFTFKSRFEPKESGGTNPEELIGAAEAACSSNSSFRTGPSARTSTGSSPSSGSRPDPT